VGSKEILFRTAARRLMGGGSREKESKTMGDKSPKAKAKSKKRDAAVKAQKKEDATLKAHPPGSALKA
jgi:hypothetical protein